MLKQKQNSCLYRRFSFRNLRALAYRKKRLSFLVAMPVLVLFALLSLKSFASGETSSLQLNYTGPVPSISFSSIHSNYGADSTDPNDPSTQGDPGAWKVDKEAHYIGDAKAKITFTIKSRMKINTAIKKDIVLVLDNSGSMWGEKLKKAKQDSVNLVTSLLSDSANRIALVKFSDNASILTPSVPISATANGTIPGSGNTYFSSAKNTVISAINTINADNNTNYFAGLKQVEEILKGYQKQANRSLDIVFMTDGDPNMDTPSEVGEYQMLSHKYPYATFTGIQYEMGDIILGPIKAISQVQYHADRTDFGNVLFEAAIKPFTYTNFVLTDYLNSTKWNISSVDDIEASIGGKKLSQEDNRVSLTKETLNLPVPYGATPTDKITWDLSNLYRSGSTAKLEITITLKDPASIKENEIIPTNDHTNLTSSFTPDPNHPIDPNNPGGDATPADPNPTPDENIFTPNSPALKYKYRLRYLPNPPKVQAGSIEAEAGQTIGADACTVENMPNPQEELHGSLETVLLSQAKLSCINKTTGTRYLFKGWQVNAKVSKLNADYFLMPETDFTISATWSRPEISKDMKGSVYKAPPLYDIVASFTKGLDTNLDFSKMDLATSGVYTYDKSSPKHSNLILKSVAEGGPVDQYNGNYLDPKAKGYNAAYISRDASGDSNGGNKDIYYFRGDVKNNNVLFANMCWKAVRTTSTGGTKLIYAGVPFNTETNATYNGATDSNVDPIKLRCTQDINSTPIAGNDATIGNSAFSAGDNSPAYAGYMYGDSSYTLTRNDNPPARTIYANDVSWDGTKYTLIDTAAVPSGGQSATRPGATKPFYQEIAEKYHYTCGNRSTTCAEVKYTNYTRFETAGTNNYYIALKNGKNIERAKVDMFQNTNSSTIKTFIDKWYNGNSTNSLHTYEKLKNYADKLEDAIYCNDRTFITGPMKSKDNGLNAYDPKNNVSLHSAVGRNQKNLTINNNIVKPSLTCANQNDSLSSLQLGNKLGLITADEAALAGNGFEGFSSGSYFNTGTRVWTLSPSGCYNYYVGAYDVDYDGQLYVYNVFSAVYWVRPVVSLSYADSLVLTGDGTIERPWIIK